MVFGFLKGSKVIDEIADEIGVDRKIYKSALTHAGVNYSLVNKMKDAALADGLSHQEMLSWLAHRYLEGALAGMQLITHKMGGVQALEDLPELRAACMAVMAYKDTRTMSARVENYDQKFR